METKSGYREQLDTLEKGQSFTLTKRQKKASVYSAIRDNAMHFKNKGFSVQTHPVTKVITVYRTK